MHCVVSTLCIPDYYPAYDLIVVCLPTVSLSQVSLEEVPYQGGYYPHIESSNVATQPEQLHLTQLMFQT